jgi:fatty-acyl-CoA synthase
MCVCVWVDVCSGGENISTIEVENVLHTHPAVSEAAVRGTHTHVHTHTRLYKYTPPRTHPHAQVVAKPDEKWGEVPCAFISLRDGHVLTEEELVAYARERLAHYKAPKRVVFGPLPKTSTGKVQKYVLRGIARGAQ